MMRFSHRLRGTALFLLALMLAAVVQEYAVRLSLPAYDPSTHLRFVGAGPDLPALGPPGALNRLVKNSGDYDVTVRFNKDGLRDDQDLARAGARDWFVVGDSFAFGWGVEENERLSERLAALMDRRVYNVAIPADLDGYAKLLAYAESKGAPVRNVVVVVNMTDDLRDYDSEVAAAPRDAPAGGGGLRRFKEYLLTHSALYFLTTSLVHRAEWLRALVLKFGLIIPLDRVSARDVTDSAIESSARRLWRISQRYEASVLVVPIRGLWIGEHREDERAIHDRFTARLRALGIDFVDMRTALEREGDPMRFHFANDGHWNPSGHALAARALAEHLERRAAR